MRKFLPIVISLSLFIFGVGIVYAHHVESINGVVHCDGSYTIDVEAQVFGNTTLRVTLDGEVISDTTHGDDESVRHIYFTGNGAEEGDPISAQVSDRSNVVRNKLVLIGGPCETPNPTPTPTPTPTVTPEPSPSITPPPSPSNSPEPTPTPEPSITPEPTPEPTPTITLPPTDTE